MKVSTKKVIISRGDFSPETIEYMWSLYENYYAYSKESFLERMKKNNYFALYLVDGFLVGFTGLRINRTYINGKKRLFIYFGQTVIDKAHRGKSLIPLTGIKLCKLFFWDLCCSKAYFWADCLTYKAYLVFRKTLADCYPSHRKALDKDTQAIRDYIGKTHYPDSYCPHTGTIHKFVNWVADESVTIDSEKLRDPDIRFFAQANPQHDQGHGLLTLAPISFLNVILMTKRFLFRSIGRHCSKQKETQTDRPMVSVLS